MTDPSRQHARVRAIFLAACEAPASERPAVLRDLCGDDTDLRKQVEALLDAERDEGFLASPPWHGPLTEGSIPDRIGPYRVVSLLGRGGTAAVYECEQDRPSRRVAVKVLRRLWASPAMMRRLDLEADALARLQHPGIAAVYGVGMADGSPYLVMELARGIPLTKFALEHRLAPRDRLRLLSEIADAVQHAHQRSVVHRDLKPANILVESDGRAKIVDFGVARLVDLDSPRTVHTEIGSVLGTLAYMSPEQAAGDIQSVDARTDVYSLGVILYELLSGRHPIEVAGKPVAEALRLIQETTPVMLGRVDRTLRGDPETIAAKALDKVPARRYQAASDLATDLRRFLAHETILARPPSAAYELRRYLRRNRMPVLVVLVFIAVVAGAIGAVRRYQSLTRIAETARAEADRQLQEVEEDNADRKDRLIQGSQTDEPFSLEAIHDVPSDFVGAMLSAAPEDIRAKMLASAAQGLGPTFGVPGDPMLRSGLFRAIAKTFYYDLHRPADAAPSFQSALALYSSVNPGADEQTTRMQLMLGNCLIDCSRAQDAVAPLTAALDYARRSALPQPRDFAVIAECLGRALRDSGRPDDAISAFQEGADRELARSPGASTDMLVECLSQKGDLLRRAHRLDQARAALREAASLAGKLDQPDRRSIQPQRYLARLEADAGNIDQAERLQLDIIASAERAFGPDNKEVVNALIELSNTYGMASPKRVADAAAALRRAYAIVSSNRGILPKVRWIVTDRLARVLAHSPDDAAEAESLRAEADELWRQSQDPLPAAPATPSPSTPR